MQSLECVCGLIKCQLYIDKDSLAPSTLRLEIWKRSFISPVRPTVQTNPSRERSFSKNALQTGGIWKRRPCVSVRTEHILKTELFENDEVTWFLCPSFPQTYIQNDRWLLCVQNSPGVVWTEKIWNVFTVKALFSNFSRVVRTDLRKLLTKLWSTLTFVSFYLYSYLSWNMYE